MAMPVFVAQTKSNVKCAVSDFFKGFRQAESDAFHFDVALLQVHLNVLLPHAPALSGVAHRFGNKYRTPMPGAKRAEQFDLLCQFGGECIKG